jgi:TPR repeat protein
MSVSHADDPSSGTPDGFDKFLVSEEHESDELIACRQAAELGDADAQFNLAERYANENGTWGEQDLAEAVRWYRQAAEQGHAQAQFYLGRCYENGTGVERDAEEAVEWYREAAQNGEARGRPQIRYRQNLDRLTWELEAQ